MTEVERPGARNPDDVLRRRLIAAATDEYRVGALSDGDYGADIERLGEVACAQRRQEEIKGIAADLGLEVPEDDALEAEARRSLRAASERRVAQTEDALEGAGPERLSCGRRHAYDEARMILRYLDDCESDPFGALAARRGT